MIANTAMQHDEDYLDSTERIASLRKCTIDHGSIAKWEGSADRSSILSFSRAQTIRKLIKRSPNKSPRNLKLVDRNPNIMAVGKQLNQTSREQNQGIHINGAQSKLIGTQSSCPITQQDEDSKSDVLIARPALDTRMESNEDHCDSLYDDQIPFFEDSATLLEKLRNSESLKDNKNVSLMISSSKYDVKKALRLKMKRYREKFPKYMKPKRESFSQDTRHNVNNQMIFKNYKLTSDGYEVNDKRNSLLDLLQLSSTFI